MVERLLPLHGTDCGFIWQVGNVHCFDFCSVYVKSITISTLKKLKLSRQIPPFRMLKYYS